MKNYYEILGLQTSATEHQIKYVFRRLAITYHPDKNPSPEAEAIFKEINEAYEILGDPDKRILYDQLLAGELMVVKDEPLQPWHKDPAYRRRRQAGYKPPPRGPSARMIMMESFLKYVKILSWISWSWCLLLVFDYVLPSIVLKEKVVTDIAKIRQAMIHTHGDLLVTENGHHFPIAMHELKYFPHESELKIFQSPVLSLLIKVENEAHSYQLNNLATVYRNFSFAPILLTILCLATFFGKKGIEFRFNLAIVTFLVFLLNICFCFISIV